LEAGDADVQMLFYLAQLLRGEIPVEIVIQPRQ
jgi:hypothetical protein